MLIVNLFGSRLLLGWDCLAIPQGLGAVSTREAWSETAAHNTQATYPWSHGVFNKHLHERYGNRAHCWPVGPCHPGRIFSFVAQLAELIV